MNRQGEIVVTESDFRKITSRKTPGSWNFEKYVLSKLSRQLR